METFRDTGVMEAQILYMLGVEPVYSPGNLVAGLKLIPAKVLNRPRIDTIISINGIYLKDFPSCARHLDEAVRMASDCSEEGNIVREHSQAIEKDLRAAGVPAERAHCLAAARIFGTEPGGGGARLVWMLPRSGTWQGRQEIIDVWREMRTYAYTGDMWGEKLPDLHDKVYAGTEGVVANWSDNLLGPLTNHHYPEETGGLAMSVQWITGKRPEVSVFDLRRRRRSRGDSAGGGAQPGTAVGTLNKAWIRGQMEHGYIGATQFMQIADDMFQWESVRAKGDMARRVGEDGRRICPRQPGTRPAAMVRQGQPVRVSGTDGDAAGGGPQRLLEGGAGDAAATGGGSCPVGRAVRPWGRTLRRRQHETADAPERNTESARR